MKAAERKQRGAKGKCGGSEGSECGTVETRVEGESGVGEWRGSGESGEGGGAVEWVEAEGRRGGVAIAFSRAVRVPPPPPFSCKATARCRYMDPTSW